MSKGQLQYCVAHSEILCLFPIHHKNICIFDNLEMRLNNLLSFSKNLCLLNFWVKLNFHFILFFFFFYKKVAAASLELSEKMGVIFTNDNTSNWKSVKY